MKFATVGSTLKALSKNKHLLAALATNFEGGTPIRFYIYFARVQQIGIEFTSLRTQEKKGCFQPYTVSINA